MSSVVIHYQEIALKGKNRPWFLNRLVQNLRTAVSDLDVRSVRALMGRIEMVLGPDASRDEVGRRIRQTFGVANFSYATKARLDLAAIADAVLRDLEGEAPASFRVSARRADKRFPMTSPQIEREIGGRIKSARGWAVDLENPQLTVHVDLLTDEGFYFSARSVDRAGCPPAPPGVSSACCRAASIHRWRRTG